MSSRLLPWFLVLAAAPLAAQAPAGSGRYGEELVRLERQRDSVARLWRAARDLVQLQDSLEHVAAVGRLDTLDVHSIRIVSNRSTLPLREAAEQLWPELDAFYGDAARQLHDRPVVIQVVRPDTGKGNRQASTAYGRQRVERWGMPVEEGTEVRQLVSYLRDVLTLDPPDSAMRVWLPGKVSPSTLGDSAEARLAFLSLVTAPYEVARRCYAGDITSCRNALRLDDAAPDGALSVLATPAERAQQVKILEFRFRRERNLEGLVECRAGDDGACTTLLRSVPTSLLPHPLQTYARQVLVHQALRLGGRDAYARLMRDPTRALGARLAEAANMPLDSLVSRWRDVTLAGRPTPVSMTSLELLVGLGWFVLLGTCVLRSSRWRFG